MSNLLISDLNHHDNSCALSKNEMKYILGGLEPGQCEQIGTITSSDGTEYKLFVCR